MPGFLVRWAVIAVSLWVAVQLISGLHVEGGFWHYVAIAAIFGLVNAIIGSLLKLFTLPLIVLTLGLFLIVINALMLELTAAIASSFQVDGFWSAILGSIVISFVSLALDLTVGDRLTTHHTA